FPGRLRARAGRLAGVSSGCRDAGRHPRPPVQGNRRPSPDTDRHCAVPACPGPGPLAAGALGPCPRRGTERGSERKEQPAMSDSTISCEEALTLLAEYLDGELETANRASLEHHIAICRGCYSRAEFERLLRDRLAPLGSEPPTPAFAQRIRSMVER